MKKLLTLVLIIMVTVACAGANAHTVRGIELIEDDRINTNQFIEADKCSACIEISNAYYIWASERIDGDNHIVRVTMYTMNGDKIFDQGGYKTYEDYVLQVNTLIRIALNAIDDGLV